MEQLSVEKFIDCNSNVSKKESHYEILILLREYLTSSIYYLY